MREVSRTELAKVEGGVFVFGIYAKKPWWHWLHRFYVDNPAAHHQTLEQLAGVDGAQVMIA